MKRKLISVSLALALGLSLAACGSKPAPSGAETPAGELGTLSGPVELQFWHSISNQNHLKVLEGLVEEFNETIGAEKGITVVPTFNGSSSELYSSVVGAIKAGSAPDVTLALRPYVADYLQTDYVVNLEPYITDPNVGMTDYEDIFEGLREANSSYAKEGIYSLPIHSYSEVLYYNKTFFAEHGLSVPTTWDELKDVAQKTTQGNVTGFAMCCLQNEEGTFNFTPWLWSTGATSYDINNDNGIKALTLVKDLVDAGSMSKEVINWTQGDVMNQFISGNIAMMVNGPWQVPTMREQAPDLNWDVTLLPKDAEYASCLGGENFGVIDGDNVDAALDFLQFATSKDEVASYIDDFGYIAARKDVAEGQFTDDETMQKFTEEMQYAQPRGPHAQWPEISDALSLAVNESITGTSTPADAAAKAQSTIDGILAE